MSNVPNDDNFEDTKMSFGEHLEELRGALFKALFGLVIAFILGLLIADEVVKFIQGPLVAALEEYYIRKAELDMEEDYDDEVPPEIFATITKDHFVLKTEKFEVSSVLECMREANPDSFGNVRYIPYRFVMDDIREDRASDLCQRLVDNEDEQGEQLLSLMTDEHLGDGEGKAAIDLVTRLAGEESVDRDDQRELIQLLNKLADLTEVHQSEAFNEDNVKGLGPKTCESLRNAFAEGFDAERDADTDASRRLNKLLIADAFSDEIRAPRVQLVDVRVWRPTEIRVQSLSAHESFMIWVKAGFISGLVIASPWIFIQVWSFVAAGLFPHEKKFVYMYMPFSIILFLAGASLAFFFVFEPVLDFLFGFNRRMNIDPDPRIAEWLGFVLFLPLGFGIAFQLPLVMLFLNRLGIFSVQQYLKKWRIAILVIFVASMLLTPADPISMLMLAAPLTVLYFLGVALCQWMPRGRRQFDEAYEP